MNPRSKNAAVSKTRTIRSMGGLSPRPAGSPNHSGAIATLAEQNGFFLFVYSPENRSLLSWSDNARDVLGVKDIAITRDANLFLRHVLPDDRFIHFAALESALAGRAPYRATYRWLRPDTNDLRWLHCRASLVIRNGERLFEGAILDLSAELSAAPNDRGVADSLAAVAGVLPYAVITTDRDLRIVRHNLTPTPDGERTSPIRLDFGDSGFRCDGLGMGRPLLDAFSDSAARSRYEAIFTAVISGETPRSTTAVGRSGGSLTIDVAPLYEHGAIVGLVITAIDSSTQTQLEERLAGLQRAEGLRTLTAGVVHNFNNALQRIIGQAALIKNHPDRVDIVSIASQTIIDIVGRTSDLSRQLFVIEEGTTPARVPIDLNVATLTAINRIKDLFSSPTTIGVAFGHTPSVLARHEPLVDAIEHLIQTMRRTAAPRGHLHIKTFEGETTPPSPQLGVHLVLAIDPAQPRSDSRTSDQPRIVPTLDEKLLSILGDFSATLSEHTTESGSHLLTLSFPLTHGTSVRSDPTLRLDRPDILVVDDDRMVLETVGAILTDLGFRPVITSRGEEVDALVERFGHSLKVAIIDALMPGTDGATIIRRLRSQAPHLIAVGFSGAPPHSTSDLEAAGAVAILRKPIDPVTLCAEITRLIGTPVAP